MIKDLDEVASRLKVFTNPSATVEEWETFKKDFEDFLVNAHIIYWMPYAEKLCEVLNDPKLPDYVIWDVYPAMTQHRFDLVKLIHSKVVDRVLVAAKNNPNFKRGNKRKY